MVIEEGQLYTIEGVAASLMILFTSYLVVSSTTLYTPMDTHINDLQMEQLAIDILMTLDSPWNYNISIDPQDPYKRYNLTQSPLEKAVSTNDYTSINNNITAFLTKSSNNPVLTSKIPITYSLNVTTPGKPSLNINNNIPPPRVNSIRATRLVQTKGNVFLVEIRLWRG